MSGADGAGAIEAFIAANLPLVPVPFVPELRLHKAVPTSGLRRIAARGSPYWAHHWGGGLALARYLLDHRAIVAGRRVLDIGTGGGIVAIAAALAGAREVTAIDVDPHAIAALRLNASANGVAVAPLLADLTAAETLPPADLATVGDLFYDRAVAVRLIALLRRYRAAGAEILVGDPGRRHLPRDLLEPLATYRVAEAAGAGDETAPPAGVFRFSP